MKNEVSDISYYMFLSAYPIVMEIVKKIHSFLSADQNIRIISFVYGAVYDTNLIKLLESPLLTLLFSFSSGMTYSIVTDFFCKYFAPP